MTQPSILRDRNKTVVLILRFLFWSFGLITLVWAFLDPRFRDVEGFLNGTFCLLISVGTALFVVGWGLAGRFRSFAFWFALALVGQAITLQMIEAGTAIRYQHYKPIDRLFVETHPMLIIYLLLQTVFVVVGVSIRWTEIRVWLFRTFKAWQIFGVAIVFLLPSAALSRNIHAYVLELILAAFIQVVNLGNIVLMVWALPEEGSLWLQRTFRRLFGSQEEPESQQSNRKDRIVILIAIWVVALAALLSFLSYERYPHVQDEIIYLFQARYFAEGKLSVPAPPTPEAFSLYLIPYESGKWYSIFPPGWPAMLAVGVLVGAPWLVNPLLAGLTVVLCYSLVKEIYNRYTANMVVLLLSVSPWFLFMSMNYMAHTLTLTCALIASVGVVWARKTGKARWAWLAGSAAGAVSLIRPLDGVIVVGLLGLWVIGIGGKRLKISGIAAFVLGTSVVSAAVLPYNKQITGDPTVFPLMAYYDQYFGPKTSAFGFGPERGLGWAIDPFPGHSPIEAIINASLNIFSVHIELLGWSIGSLFLIALIIFSRKMSKNDYSMLVVVAVIFVFYGFYWFSGGPDFGARYWYLMIVPLLVLSVRAILFLQEKFESLEGEYKAKGAHVMVALASLSVLSLINYIPWRAIDKYHHYLGMRPDVKHLSEEHNFGKSLVLIQGNRFPDYSAAWVQNPLDPHADSPVYAWDKNEGVRDQVLNAYIERPIWIVQGPTLSNDGYKVVDGPLSAHELIVKGVQDEISNP